MVKQAQESLPKRLKWELFCQNFLITEDFVPFFGFLCFLISKFQILALILYFQFLNRPSLYLDQFTAFLVEVFDVLMTNNIDAKDLKRYEVLGFLYLLVLLFLLFVYGGLEIKKGSIKRWYYLVSMGHLNIVYFIIQILSIRTFKNNGNDASETALGIINLILNNVIAVWFCLFCTFKFIRKEGYIPNEPIYNFMSFFSKFLISLFMLREPSNKTVTAVGFIVGVFFCAFILQIKKRFPFYNPRARRLSVFLCFAFILAGLTCILGGITYNIKVINKDTLVYSQILLLVFIYKYTLNTLNQGSYKVLAKCKGNIERFSVIKSFLVSIFDLHNSENSKERNLLNYSILTKITSFGIDEGSKESISKVDIFVIKVLENSSFKVQDPLTIINLAEIYLNKEKSLEKCIFTLGSLSNKLTFFDSLLASHLKQNVLDTLQANLTETGKRLNIQEYANRHLLEEKFLNSVTKSMGSQMSFWKIFESEDLKTKQLLNCSRQIESQIPIIDNLWKSLESNSNTSTIYQFYLVYALYLALIKNSPSTAEKYVKKYHRATKTVFLNKDMALSNEIDILDNSNMIFKISLQAPKKFHIVQTSPNISLLGWSSHDLIGKSVMTLVPNYFEKEFKGKNFDLVGMLTQINFIGKSFLFFIKNREGDILPCTVFVSLEIDIQGNMFYLVFVKVRETMLEYMILNHWNKVVACTKKINQQLEIRDKIIQIERICPDFYFEIEKLSRKRKVTSVSNLDPTNVTLYKLKSHIKMEYDLRKIDIKLGDFSYTLLELFQAPKFLKIPSYTKTMIYTSPQKSIPSSCEFDSLDERKSESKYNFKCPLQTQRTQINFESKETQSSKLESPGKLKDVKEASMDIEIKKKKGKKKNLDYLNSSVTTISRGKRFKIIEENINSDIKTEKSFLLRAFACFLFVMSSISLLIYYSMIKNNFEKISTNMAMTSNTIELMTKLLEIRKIANNYYLLSNGIYFPTKFVINGKDYYDSYIREHFINVIEEAQLVQKKFQDDLIDNYNHISPIIYKDFVKIVNPNDGNTTLTSLNRALNMIFSSSYHFIKIKNLTQDNPDLHMVIENSMNDLLLGLEGVTDMLIRNTEDLLDSSFSNLITFLVAILIQGIFLIGLIFMREHRMQKQKEYLWSVVAALDQKEIENHLFTISQAVLAIKTNNQPSIMETYRSLFSDIREKTFVKNKSTINLKKSSQLTISSREFYKITILVLIFIMLMAFPFLLLDWMILISGQTDKIKQNIDIVYKTSLDSYEMKLLICSFFDYIAYNKTSFVRNLPLATSWPSLYKQMGSFQEFLGGIPGKLTNSSLKDILSGDLCKILKLDACQSYGSSILEGGIIGMNAYHLIVMRDLIDEYDASNMSIEAQRKALNGPNILNSDIYDSIFNSAGYKLLITTEKNETRDDLDSTSEKILTTILAGFLVNLVLGVLLTEIISLRMKRERETWHRLIRRVPFRLVFGSKLLRAYLNNFTRRNFE